MLKKLSSVTVALLVINVAVFLLTMNWDSRLMLALFPPSSELFLPFQILSHFFMHGNSAHLLFNMFGLYMFGSVLEQIWGAKLFLLFYLLCALGAAALQFLVWRTGLADPVPILGASGAIYGVFVGFAMLFPNHRIMLIIPPIPMKAKYMIAGLIVFDVTLGVSGAASGIAHFAHLGGAIVGAVYVLWWKKKTNFRFQP